MSHHSPSQRSFFADSTQDFESRTILGSAGAGAADIGEVFATIGTIVDGNTESWISAWVSRGSSVVDSAREAERAGKIQTAAARYLRGSNYLGRAINALAGTDDGDRLRSVFHQHRAAWDAFARLSDDISTVTIPSGDTSLPGYFIAASQQAGAPRPGQRHPVLIVVNGSDGTVTDAYAAIGAAARLRGYAVLLFDAPGQQSELFDHNTTFRSDFEHVLTPVIDWLVGQDGVDTDRLVAYGISQAGYWVPRALAFEHRLGAAIVDPGIVDVATSWTDNLPGFLKKHIDRGEDNTFDREMALGLGHGAKRATWNFRARPYGQTSFAATLRAVMTQRIDGDLAAEITTPLLITNPDDEAFWPGQSEKLAALVPHSTVLSFTASDGANYHCEPLGRLAVNEQLLDWADGILGR